MHHGNETRNQNQKGEMMKIAHDTLFHGAEMGLWQIMDEYPPTPGFPCVVRRKNRKHVLQVAQCKKSYMIERKRTFAEKLGR